MGGELKCSCFDYKTVQENSYCITRQNKTKLLLLYRGTPKTIIIANVVVAIVVTHARFCHQSTYILYIYIGQDMNNINNNRHQMTWTNEYTCNKDAEITTYSCYRQVHMKCKNISNHGSVV